MGCKLHGCVIMMLIELVMHQSFVSPALLGPGIPGTKRGLSTEILPPMSPGSAVDVPGF